MSVLKGSGVVVPSQDLVEAAVKAVKDRDRHFRQWILTVGFFLAAALALQTMILYDQTQSTQNLQEAQSKVQTEITCALAAETQVTTQYLSKFAKRFGGPLPPVPGLPHECGGNDPVFIGTMGNDTIYGTTDPDWINGEEGNDHLYAKGGGDTLIGYKGSDFLYGGNGSDYIYGGDGNDELHAGGDSKVDHLDGGAGTDTCYARVNDVLTSCERVIRIS